MAEEKKRPCNEKTVCIQPTTGGQIEMKVPQGCTVACLKKALSKRIRVPKERIVLLHRNKQLVEGTLEGNSVDEGSKLTLLPNVETGIMQQKQELGVMQALETLSDGQVESFLNGKSPLNLTMRLGDHMMFIQLQLSTVTPARNAPLTTPSPLPTPPSTPTTPSTPLVFPTPFSSNVGVAPPSPPPSPTMTFAPQMNPAAAGNSSNNNNNSNCVLAQASRNLTHALKNLSSSAINQKMNESYDGRFTSRRQTGAVIESMFHHGKGVYSGTFSGTLNPSLQDKDGRPRRDVTTIIHILNDLLGASSHCGPSAQCLCTTIPASTTTTPSKVTPTAPPDNSRKTSSSPRPQTPSSTSSQTDVIMSDVKIEGSSASSALLKSKQDENKILRQKVEQIQSMLEERRKQRKARRKSPYPSRSRTVQDNGRTSSGETSSSSKPSTSAAGLDAKIPDFSGSETGVVA